LQAMKSQKRLHSLCCPERQGEQMPLHMTATGAALSNELALFGSFAREVRQRIGAVFAARAPGVFDSYRPELHYMRGPGPKWRQTHGFADCTTRSLLRC